MVVRVIAEFNKKKTLFTSKLEFNLKKEPVKCYIWSIALYGTETWTLRRVDKKCLESVKMWCWWRMEKTISKDSERNEVIYRVKEEGNANWIGHILLGNCFLKHIIEGKIERKDRSDGKTRKKTYASTGWFYGNEGILETERGNIRPTLWRTCFGRGYGSVLSETTG